MFVALGEIPMIHVLLLKSLRVALVNKLSAKGILG